MQASSLQNANSCLLQFLVVEFLWLRTRDSVELVHECCGVSKTCQDFVLINWSTFGTLITGKKPRTLSNDDQSDPTTWDDEICIPTIRGENHFQCTGFGQNIERRLMYPWWSPWHLAYSTVAQALTESLKEDILVLRIAMTITYVSVTSALLARTYVTSGIILCFFKFSLTFEFVSLEQ